MKPEEKTREQALQEHIHRDAGLVRIDALVAYLEACRASVGDALLNRNCTERDADWYRGKAAACRDLIHELTTPPENP